MKCVRILFILVLSIAFFLPHFLSAQEPSRKTAYISLSRVFDDYYKTKNADEKLEKEAEKKNKERDKVVEKINKLRDEMALLSQEARGKKEGELSEQMRGLQDFDRETKLSLQRKRNDAVKEIFKEIDEAIKEYGRANNYCFILDERALVYVDDSADLTDDILKILNKGN